MTSNPDPPAGGGKSSRKPNIAAIDLGTNSFHMVIAEPSSSGKFKILGREKEMVRLGSGAGGDMKVLEADAIRRGVECLRIFRQLADAFNAEVRAVATSAVREAQNQDAFLEAVENETGIRVDVISGVEEARLIYLGILQGLPFFNQRVLIIDIGGGSTEYLVGEKGEALFARSLKLGAIRLTRRFFRKKSVESKDAEQCRKFLKGRLAPIRKEIKKTGFDVAIGSSGTVQNLAAMINLRKGKPNPMSFNNFVFSKKDLEAVVGEILAAGNAKQRAKLAGLDPKRADIIVAGALTLSESFNALNIREITVSDYALREGVLLDTMQKFQGETSIDHLTDLRYQSVIHLAEHLNYERDHSHQTTRMSLQIFDQTKMLHNLSNTERELLEAAALLHEVGFFVSHTAHHRHSYYLIRNSELPGFTDNEQELIANIARYHRKSHPSPKHENFVHLKSRQQDIVRKLAAILRVADGLDRTHNGLIESVTCSLKKSGLKVTLATDGQANLEIEMWGAEVKKQLFEEVFNVNISFDVAS